MVDELELVEQLDRIQMLLKNGQIELAEQTVLAIKERTLSKVEAFERDMDFFFKDTQFYNPVREV